MWWRRKREQDLERELRAHLELEAEERGDTDAALPMPANSPRPGERLNVFFLACSDSFLSTMRIPLILGRGLAPSDGPGRPPVAVVNETFVKDYFLAGEDPVGQNSAAAREPKLLEW